MGLLQRTRVYLSGAMEFADGAGWRQQVKRDLEALKILFFDPYDKPFITSLPETEEIRIAMKARRMPETVEEVSKYFKQVRSDDLRLCDICDFCIVHINPKIPSWGTAEELTTLNRMKKPIFIAVDGGIGATPLWLLGMLPPKYFYNSIEEIVDTIKKIDSGEIKIDSDRWRLLKPELR